jgi:hypothetical protein
VKTDGAHIDTDSATLSTRMSRVGKVVSAGQKISAVACIILKHFFAPLRSISLRICPHRVLMSTG